MNKKVKKEVKTKYSKQQIINSKQYSAYKDVLQAILKDTKQYTNEEVNKNIEDFMKRKV